MRRCIALGRRVGYWIGPSWSPRYLEGIIVAIWYNTFLLVGRGKPLPAGTRWFRCTESIGLIRLGGEALSSSNADAPVQVEWPIMTWARKGDPKPLEPGRSHSIPVLNLLRGSALYCAGRPEIIDLICMTTLLSLFESLTVRGPLRVISILVCLLSRAFCCWQPASAR
jgi:hypothetical protein